MRRSQEEAPAALEARTGAKGAAGAFETYTTPETAATQRSIFEAEAHGAVLRAANHAAAGHHALEEAGHALDQARLLELAQALGKVAELHRLASTRLAAVLRRLGESTL